MIIDITSFGDFISDIYFLNILLTLKFDILLFVSCLSIIIVPFKYYALFNENKDDKSNYK